ncbi:HNH endonuclease [Streptomyces sp. NPDC058662]|uniref:HNH endonuclease n=1 Tax=Streptomyces sp. NPDC058662 TaxID=3346583 RepID=UPI0036513DA9
MAALLTDGGAVPTSTLTDQGSVIRALNEYRDRGRASFLEEHDFGPAKQYFLQFEGTLYDAKAIANVAYLHQHGSSAEPPISGGQFHSNRLLEQLGFVIVDSRPTTVDGERIWRMALWDHLRSHYDLTQLPAQVLRDFGAYGGGQGIWLDAERTRSIHRSGITVGVLHTGAHYPDDLGEHSVLYQYPKTDRPGRRDESEITATKTAASLRLPIFVIAKPTPHSRVRIVRLAWVEGWEDESEQFLITYAEDAPRRILHRDDSDQEPFQLRDTSRRRRQRAVHDRPGQPRFKLQVFHRYGPRCPLTGIAVPQMIEAAHLCPVAEGGSDDPRNGLPLSAGLHRAFDAHLFTIHPETLNVITRPGGPTAADLHITIPHLRDLIRKPQREALDHRYQTSLERWS